MILNRPINKYSRKALAQTIAFVPQMIPVDFPFTVKEIVLMGRSPYLGMLGLEQEKDFKFAKQALTFTGVEHLAHRKLDQLSGGEQHRVFIAKAICQEPKIILLDEPTASLDLAHQVRLMDLMEKLKNETGITVVMVSHDVNLAAMYGDRLLLLNKGEIVQIGDPKEVLTFQTLPPRQHSQGYAGTRKIYERRQAGRITRLAFPSDLAEQIRFSLDFHSPFHL